MKKIFFPVFHFMRVAANASELFSMAYLANNERFLYHSNLFIQDFKLYVHVNSSA